MPSSTMCPRSLAPSLPRALAILLAGLAMLEGASAATPAPDAASTLGSADSQRPAWLDQARNRRKPGSTFEDRLASGGSAPTMVVIPAGTFRMGSPADEPDRIANEGPQREVKIAGFALGRTEVSRGQFEVFVGASGYRTEAERNITPPGRAEWPGCQILAEDEVKLAYRPGSSWRKVGVAQTDEHPVVCVTWNDAQAYVEWLSRETKQHYRLPSEAEFEYALRAGAGTTWPWGTDPDAGCATANGADESGRAGMRERFGLTMLVMFSISDCDDGHAFTSPVGALAPNAFGLHDMVGNVYEWTEDCFQGDYVGAPADATPRWVSPCTSHPTRGGAWSDQSAWLRAAVRIGLHPMNRNHNTGFRVARDLAPAAAATR
jgi:formylglycine-generating enzyme required for sulfatase activity